MKLVLFDLDDTLIQGDSLNFGLNFVLKKVFYLKNI